MTKNLSEAVEKMTRAGVGNVKSVWDASNGKHNIEIRTGGVWVPIITGLSKDVAETLIKKAENRTILG